MFLGAVGFCTEVKVSVDEDLGDADDDVSVSVDDCNSGGRGSDALRGRRISDGLDCSLLYDGWKFCFNCWMSCLAADSFGMGCFGGGMRILCSSFSIDSAIFGCVVVGDTIGCGVSGVSGVLAGDLLFALVVMGWKLGLGVLLVVLDFRVVCGMGVRGSMFMYGSSLKIVLDGSAGVISLVVLSWMSSVSVEVGVVGL